MLHSDRRDSAQRSRLVQLKRGSGPEVVFIVPGSGGSMLTLVQVSRSYPGPEYLFGLEPASRPALPPSAGSVAELASSHLEAAARCAASGGRWHLAGHDFGATVVMEMAHQLERAGERLGVTALLQPLLRLGGALEEEEMGRADLMLRAADRLRRTAGRDDPETGDDLRCLGLEPGILELSRELGLELPERIAFALQAYRDHTTRPISGPVDLLLTGDVDSTRTVSRLHELTGGVRCHRLPGSPASVLRDPHARTAAGAIASLVAAGRGG